LTGSVRPTRGHAAGGRPQRVGATARVGALAAATACGLGPAQESHVDVSRASVESLDFVQASVDADVRYY